MFNFNNQNRNNFSNNAEMISNAHNENLPNEAHNENTINVKVNNSNHAMNFETLQKARRDLMGELEAIIGYDNSIHATNLEIAKETWQDIRNEELNHMGQLLALITHLAPYQKELIESGMKEFEDNLKKQNR